MSKTDPINPNVPLGTEDPKQGDNRIRALARAVAEILSKDHYIGSDSGSGYDEDAAGEHSKVTIRNGSAPSSATGKGFLYVVSGELYYKDPSGNAIQLTKSGIANVVNLTGNQTIAGVKTFSSQISLPAGLTTAAALISTLVTGTPPLTIASTTKVPNLNADKIDGYDVNPYSGGESHTYPGGLIVKIGHSATPSGNLSSSITTVNITFGTEFPNGIIVVIPILRYGDTTSDNRVSCGYYNPAKTGFTFVCHEIFASNQNLAGFDWIALGY